MRGLYNYEPSAGGGGDEAENDLCFNKDDTMVVIKEYVSHAQSRYGPEPNPIADYSPPNFCAPKIQIFDFF